MKATTATRREALATMLAAGLAPAIARGGQRAPGDKPNLLFLWTDQQRADTFGAYGNHTYRTPVMNQLAESSIVFDRAYVAQPVCTPSRSTVMTGLWPHTSGCVNNNRPLPKECKTVPELLADSSYRTGYFGKWHLGDEVFAQHGFEEWQAIEDNYQRFFSKGRNPEARSQYHQFLSSLGYKPDEENYFSREMASRLPAKHSKPAFLAEKSSEFIMANRNQPWMLYVNFLEPHTPFSSAYNDLHSEEEAPIPANWPGIDAERDPDWAAKRRAKQGKGGEFGTFDVRDRAKVQRANRNYAGLCSLVDQALGRILWSLEASGQADNTIVVFTSDHGEMLGAHSLYGKQVMYEESVRVPLLLRVPFRRQRQMRVAQPISHIDLAPTMLHLLGHKDWGDLPGFSHAARLEGRKSGDGHVSIEWTADGQGVPDARAVISPDGWKYVLHQNDKPMLFHRHTDPLEMDNRQATDERKRTELQQRLDQWSKQVGDKRSF